CSWRAPVQPTPTASAVKGGVTFSDVVLARADTKGQLRWKLEAKGVTYGEGQSVSKAKSIKGQLYEKGRPIFDIVAQSGTVRQSDQQVRLQGNIQVSDRQNRLVFRGREAQWNAQSGVLTVQNGLTVTHPQLQLWAKVLQASQRGQVVRVSGQVVMETRPMADNATGRLQLKANRALWQVAQQQVQAGEASTNPQQPTVEVKRLDAGQDSAIALAGTVQANLNTGVVQLTTPVQLQRGSLQLATRTLTWDTQKQRIFSPELVQIQDAQRQISVLANQGTLLERESLVDLQGKVEMKGLRNDARLATDQLLWHTNTQRIEAVGNVNYQQTSPQFSLKGPRAVGRIADQTVRISGGNVVTEIVP
ncbi:MAG TPA: LPS export ABC transporter periplasmic protein LptC, partial [Stenomitos sp.]